MAETNYRKLNDELERILTELQDADLDIDEAMNRYERGLVIVRELQDYLKTAENKVSKLQAKFKDSSKA